MSFKLNQNNPNRRKNILARRERTEDLPYAGIETVDKYGRKGVKFPKQGIDYRGSGTPMKMSNRNAVMRQLIKYKDLFTDEEKINNAKLALSGGMNRNMLMDLVRGKKNVKG